MNILNNIVYCYVVILCFYCFYVFCSFLTMFYCTIVLMCVCRILIKITYLLIYLLQNMPKQLTKINDISRLKTGEIKDEQDTAAALLPL